MYITVNRSCWAMLPSVQETTASLQEGRSGGRWAHVERSQSFFTRTHVKLNSRTGVVITLGIDMFESCRVRAWDLMTVRVSTTTSSFSPETSWPSAAANSKYTAVRYVNNFIIPLLAFVTGWFHSETFNFYSKGKDKGTKICIAPHRKKLTSEALRYGSQFLHCKHTMLPSPRKRSPDGGATD